MSHVAIVAHVTVKEGKADEYIAAFAPLLEGLGDRGRERQA
jgi:hypothetical protein